MIKYDTLTTDGYTETSEGYIVVKARIARIGIQQYMESDVIPGGNPSKVVNVMRLATEVFCPESMATMSNLTITNNHPKEGKVNSSTWKKYAVGLGGVATQDGDHLIAVLTLTDAAAIKTWKGGRREVSMGYSCEDYAESGKYNGEPYEYVQRNIIGNHIALVDRGRCGGSCRTDGTKQEPNEVKETMKMKIDGIQIEIADETATGVVQNALDTRDGIIAKMKSDAEKTAKEKEEIEKEVDGFKKKVKKMEEEEKEKKDSAPNIDKLVADRQNNVAIAKQVMGGEYKWQDRTCDQIKKDCVIKSFPDMKLDGETSDYIEGLYTAVASAKMIVKDNAMGDLFNSQKIDSKKQDARSEYVDGLVNYGKKEDK